VRTVSVRLLADINGYTTNMRKAATETRSLSKEIDKAAKGGRLDEVTNMATGLGIGLLGAAAVAVKFSMAFEKQMSGVKAATHASTAEINALREASLQAGKDTSFSATEAAKGVEEMAKAGIATADILGGGLKGALDLAAAGELGVGEAAETAASALTQFKLKGKDVPHVADLLSAAAGKAQGSVSDMGQALNQVGLIAAGTGLSIEETTGTLAAFASAGLIGSDAGTSFKTMLQAIQAPSGKTKELMDDLGVSAYDAGGNFIGIANFAQVLKDKLGKLTPELRANAMAQIFGSDATRAANILYEQGSIGITEWISKTNDAGYAAETAAIKTDNLAGDVERLKGALETAAIESGGGLNQGLRILTKGADGLVSAISSLPAGTTAAITVMSALGGVLMLGSVAWLKARVQMAAVTAELNAMGPAGARAAVGLQAASKAAGIAGLAFVGLEIAGAVFDRLGNGAVNVNKLTMALEDYATTGRMSAGLTDEFGKDLEDFGLIAQSAEAASHGFWGGFNDFFSAIPGVGSAIDSMNESLQGTSFNDATDRMAALDQSFAAFIATQKDANKTNEIWRQLIAKSGLDTQQLLDIMPNATAATRELQKAADAGAGAQGQLATSTTKTTEELEKEKQALEAAKKAFDALFSSQMSIDQANLQVAEGTASLTKELTTGRRELGLNTAEGRKNRAAVLDQIGSINSLRESRIKHGESLDVASGKYLKDIAGLRNSMKQAGFTKKQIDGLVGSYEAIPRSVSTKVAVVGDKAALSKLANLKAYQDALKQGSNVVSIRKQLSKDNADFMKFDVGGRTPNVGIHEPAGVVHGQEFVLDARTVKSIDRQAPGFLEEVHATHGLPGYAAGGRVATWPFPTTAAGTRIPTMAQALAVVGPVFSGNWPGSPSAQRGDSGVWRQVLQLIHSGPKSGSFGNAYRPGDPKWHGSGRAVDWMGYNQDALASYLASKRPLELIHRTNQRDYAYTRGVNKGSFSSGLMQAHRNHIHIAMQHGGTIMEPVFGVGQSGATYSFGEGGRHERVIPTSGGGGGGNTFVTVQAGYVVSERDLENKIAMTIDRLRGRGRD
jgi:TP901 family phage tail tape measure protein